MLKFIISCLLIICYLTSCNDAKTDEVNAKDNQQQVDNTTKDNNNQINKQSNNNQNDNNTLIITNTLIEDSSLDIKEVSKTIFNLNQPNVDAKLQINGRTAFATDDTGRTVLRISNDNTPSPSGEEAGSVYIAKAIKFYMDDNEKKTKREYDRNIETGKFKDTLFSEDDYDGQMYDFSTFFRFRIPAKATYEGSGLVFVIQNDPRENKALGKCAECMGFGGDISSNMRISPSFAVEFDVVETHEDWDNNMIGINYHGNLESSEQRYPEDRLNNGDVWNVWIDYNDDVFKLYVTTSSVKPLKPLLEKIVQLDTNLTKRFIKKGQDTKIYVGFTSDPGLFPANHDILEWKFRNYHNPFGDAPVVVRGLDQR